MVQFDSPGIFILIFFTKSALIQFDWKLNVFMIVLLMETVVS